MSGLSGLEKSKLELNQDPNSRPGNRKIAVIVAMIASVAIAGTYFGIVYFSQSPCPSGVTLRSFVIIANDTTGYNGSRYQSFQMDVQKDECVLISFVNNSTSQSHGLAISHYFENGMVAQPKTTETTRFGASETGQFRVYEQLFSTIYSFTRNAGTLGVV